MKYPFEVESLPYSYDALEPYLNEETLYFHHDKHYANYVMQLNSIIKNYPNLQNMTLSELLIRNNSLPGEAKHRF